MRGEGEFRYQALGWKLGRARVQGGGWAAKPREIARAPEQAAAVAFYITMAQRLLGTTRNRASTLTLCWVIVGTEVGRKWDLNWFLYKQAFLQSRVHGPQELPLSALELEHVSSHWTGFKTGI